MAALKITGAGATAEYLGQKVSVKKHFDTFAATDASELGGIKWDALSEETLCSKDVYERFAYFLMQVHPNGLKLGLAAGRLDRWQLHRHHHKFGTGQVQGDRKRRIQAVL